MAEKKHYKSLKKNYILTNIPNNYIEYIFHKKKDTNKNINRMNLNNEITNLLKQQKDKTKIIGSLFYKNFELTVIKVILILLLFINIEFAFGGRNLHICSTYCR